MEPLGFSLRLPRIGVLPMDVDITPRAAQVLRSRGGTMAIDFIRPTG